MAIIPISVSAKGITDIIDAAFSIVKDVLIPLAFALCLLYFFWGVVKYLRSSAGSDNAAEEGRRIMVWGIVGLFVASSIWGIVSFIQKELTLKGLPTTEGTIIK